jgi:hypothetical protein
MVRLLTDGMVTKMQTPLIGGVGLSRVRKVAL